MAIVVKRDPGSILGSGRSPGGGHGNLLQYSCLENPMDRGTWQTSQSLGLQRVGHDWSYLAAGTERLCCRTYIIKTNKYSVLGTVESRIGGLSNEPGLFIGLLVLNAEAWRAGVAYWIRDTEATTDWLSKARVITDWLTIRSWVLRHKSKCSFERGSTHASVAEKMFSTFLEDRKVLFLQSKEEISNMILKWTTNWFNQLASKLYLLKNYLFILFYK